ncbi:MAG: 16S rRNA (guanine(966)-N(2))-methyltransferase RsmD [Oscillibacter sp.]|jgi:16S rRNA (guanine966-N2)-methyltransferase|nr:16S rRNA (guanine(966)-N(2))-methyltransferase RsmD [uncultured Oscillibacter sp.]MCI9643604.1 16S rRNA (guanine(966)-N(2))-methyltransferase RsmD [Oscillibacter sp.]
MRVITGSAGGRRLLELEGLETRPTTDRVKEGVFSALQFDIEGRRVLDLFAGTGQMGIECLSRGAASAVFVDQRKDAFEVVKKNLALTDLQDRAQVVCGNARDFVARACGGFDLVFLDPPYASGLLEEMLERITAPGFDILGPYGIIVAEHPADRRLAVPAGCRLRKTYRYGKIAVTLFRREGNE